MTKATKRAKPTRTAEEVAEGKRKTAEARKKAKTELDANNLRNRLFKSFGDAIRRKDGQLPSHVKLLASLMLRTWGVLSRGKDEVRPERIRTIPVGLATVLRDSPIEGVTALTMAQRFTEVSDHASKVRVNASLLANFIFIRALTLGGGLPNADKAFFTACLSCCRGASTSSRAVVEEFAAFSAATGITAYPPMAGTTRVFENQATDMATAAGTFIEHQFHNRRTTLLKWGLKVRLRSQIGVSDGVFKTRIGQLCTFLLCPGPRPTEEAIIAMLRELGFGEDSFDSVQQLCELVLGFAARDDPSKLRHLLELQELFVTQDRLRYETVCSAAHAAFPLLHPEDTNKEARAAMIHREWAFFESPPSIMTPLPVCHNAATFIRLCKKSVCELFPRLKVCMEDGDPWWYRAIMDPFSKAAAITCLRSPLNKYARSEHGMFAGLRMMMDGEDLPAPWMVGPSFETDGKQIRLNLLTTALDHPGAPGLLELQNAGYNVSFSDTTLEQVLAKGDGVYNLRHVHTTAGLAGFDGVTVTPVDPGQVCVVEGAHIPGTECRLENAAGVMFGPHQRVSFSGEDWQTKTFTKKSTTAEAYRRRPVKPFGQALELLRSERKKTCDLPTFVRYCVAWGIACPAIWAELLTAQRRGHRFLRFRAIQRTIEEIAEQVAPIKGGRELYGRRVVMFEDGMWKSKKGCASAPTKKIVRAVCQRAAVIMVPAAYSSMTCVGCYHKTKKGASYRTRLCTTSPGCLLHPHTPSIEFDRDFGAKAVIATRGVYVVSGLWSANRNWRPIGYNV
jgi:hypothetical protein